MLDFNDVRLARPEGTPCAFQVSAGATAIRQTPAPDGLVMTFALHGETLDLFREEGEFGLVQCRRDRYIGWTLMEALSAPVLPVTHKVKALRTYAFSRPDIKSSPISCSASAPAWPPPAARKASSSNATGQGGFTSVTSPPRRLRGRSGRCRPPLPGGTLSLGRKGEPRARLLGSPPAGLRGVRCPAAPGFGHAACLGRV